MDCYRERAHLLALLATHYPSHLYVPSDEEDDFHYALCIHFPWGQASWHLATSDLVLFDQLPVTGENHYDGHTTEEKYAAIQRNASQRLARAF